MEALLVVLLMLSLFFNAVSTLVLGGRVSSMERRLSRVESGGPGSRIVTRIHVPADPAYGDVGEVESK